MYNQKLNGMTAVITGGNGVIGGVFARALAGEGADIAIICRNTGSAESWKEKPRSFRGMFSAEKICCAAEKKFLPGSDISICW